MILKQTQFLKGSREFEILDETLFVHIKSFFKEEKLTVDLSTLNPEPVIAGSEVIFYSDYKGRPILSLLLNKPSTEEFTAFVDALKQTIRGNDGTDTGIETEIAESTRQEALSRNFHEEPPAFAEPDEMVEEKPFRTINPDRLEEDIAGLKLCMDENAIKPLLDSLETLMAEPESKDAYENMLAAFNELGFNQGAVLTYAPYVKVLVSESIHALERLGASSYDGVKGS